MKKLPSLKAREVAKVLEKLGFELKRQKGSHMVYKHSDGRMCVVPNHPSEYLDRGLLNKLIKKEMRISRKRFFELLK